MRADAGARVLTGGERLTGRRLRGRVLRGADRSSSTSVAADDISRTELFGPITCLYRVKGFEEAIALANDSPFGLTAAIHTANINRAMTFIGRIQSGVAVVNGGTYGSEPHMPFGGLRQSGNGWREAGTEALDVYSDLKTIYINHNPGAGLARCRDHATRRCADSRTRRVQARPRQEHPPAQAGTRCWPTPLRPALAERRLRRRHRVDRFGGDRRRRAALRRRGAVPAAGGVCRRYVAGHRVASSTRCTR